MMKKIILITGLIVFSFGYCCPESCDPNVKVSFQKLKKAINGAYQKNLNELSMIQIEYQTILNTENSSVKLLNSYLKRIGVEYIITKKTNFLLDKDIALKALK